LLLVLWKVYHKFCFLLKWFYILTFWTWRWWNLKKSILHIPSLYILLSVCLPNRLSIYLFFSLLVHLSICPSNFLYICTFICLWILPSVCLFTRLSFCLSVHLSFCPSDLLSLSLSIHMSICPSVCMSTYLSVFQFVSPCVSLSIHPVTCPSVHQMSVHTSICLSVHQSVPLSVLFRCQELLTLANVCRVCTIKLFTAVFTDFRNKLECLSGKPFQPSLMFVSGARSLP
jgi:hypothetical protein